MVEGCKECHDLGETCDECKYYAEMERQQLEDEEFDLWREEQAEEHFRQYPHG